MHKAQKVALLSSLDKGKGRVSTVSSLMNDLIGTLLLDPRLHSSILSSECVLECTDSVGLGSIIGS